MDFSDFRIGRNDFLQRLDGMVFGEDPRQGGFSRPVIAQKRMNFAGIDFQIDATQGGELRD